MCGGYWTLSYRLKGVNYRVFFFFVLPDWCPENMTYYLETGVCVANKKGVTWDEGDLFCRSLYPGAHLIDIKSEEEQLALAQLFGSNS